MTTTQTTRFSIDYTGPMVGLNAYRELNWKKLRDRVDGVKWHFLSTLLCLRPPRLAWMELTVSHNTNYDMDNIAGMVKPCVDALRARSIIPDDNRQFWNRLTIVYDAGLPKKTIRFEVYGGILPKE